MPLVPLRLRALALPCAAALILGCAGSRGGEDGPRPGSVAWLVQQERFREAVEKAAAASARAPEDEHLSEEYRRASVAWLIDRGRTVFLEGGHAQALELFLQAREIAPRTPAVADWIQAAQERLADQAFTLGLEAHTDDDLALAVEHYEEALTFDPEHYQARSMLARALVQQNYRRGMGEEYYGEGIMALDRYFLHEANSMFAYVLKYEPADERAEQRSDHARRLLAEERAAVALGLEQAGQFSAARNEFRLALVLDPELELAQLGLLRMRREEIASEKIREADRMRLRGDFDAAAERLESLRSQTDRQGEEIDRLLVEVGESRVEALYKAARRLESDWRYDEAVRAYDRLLEVRPFYKDALARRDTLAVYVRDAEELYARYQASDDPAERLELLERIAEFWPEYRDVSARLAELD